MENNFYLMHHGVKGQKWGIRKKNRYEKKQFIKRQKELNRARDQRILATKRKFGSDLNENSKAWKAGKISEERATSRAALLIGTHKSDIRNIHVDHFNKTIENGKIYRDTMVSELKKQVWQ